MELETGEIPMLLTLKVQCLDYSLPHMIIFITVKQIPIGEKVEITFHYKKAFSLVREVSGKFYITISCIAMLMV